MHNAASQPETTQSSYLFPNRDPETPVRFAALSQMFDDITIQHLIACGVTTGWHCLEVGAGGGSIANGSPIVSELADTFSRLISTLVFSNLRGCQTWKCSDTTR